MALLITFKWHLPRSKESLGTIFEIALLFFFKNNICFDRNEKIDDFLWIKANVIFEQEERRYLNIINGAFLLPPHPENFENEIAPLKTPIAFSF